MENDSLKIQLDSIQQILNYCIAQTYNVLIGKILRKKSIQFKEILGQYQRNNKKKFIDGFLNIIK